MSAEMPDSHHFEHEAMKTTFSLRIRHLERDHAAFIAHKCFEDLDILESKLSRFIETSDISRINVMREGETLYISEETHRCLLQALDYFARSGGLFDITLGRAIEHRKAELDGPAPASEGSLMVHPDCPAVTCQSPGRVLDLGGIGKGFALDSLKELLVEWRVESALLAAGASTQLAFGESTWPIEIIGEKTRHRIDLKDAALSASGTGIQGSHIVHPDGDEQRLPWKHVWLTAATATAADVWSTALMLLPDPNLLDLSEINSLYVEDEDGISQRNAGR